MTVPSVTGFSRCGFCKFEGDRLPMFAGKTQIGSKCQKCGGVLRFSKKELLANMDTGHSPTKVVSSLFKNSLNEKNDKPNVASEEGDATS